MAYPTQITIASGRTLYAGDPGNDEGIASRQVQVQVTYQLERGDDDLLLVTETKAREVEAAQAAVWRRVNGEQTELRMDGGHEAATVDDVNDDGEDHGPPYGDRDVPPDEDSDNGSPEADDDPCTVPAPDCPAGGVCGPQARPVTKPQRLVLAAQARRLGLSDQALAEEIRERFGKTSLTPRFAVDRLSSAEADALLRALCAMEPLPRTYH